MPTSMAIFLSRIRLPAVALFLGLSIANRFWPVLPGGWYGWLAGLALVAVLLRAGTLRREPVAVRPPVGGPWRALNSPATRVPSHGIQGYGQAYAIDLVYDPADAARARPRFAWWPPARRPQDFPSFGQPVYAPADGVVLRVHDRERDHWSRTSPLGLLYLLTVELLRELTGPSRVVGNHVIIDLGGGCYAVLAHLRRRSIRVTAGQHVRAGDQIAECGNSGNATEPHLHFQLMDHPVIAVAAGLPFRFTTASGAPTDTPPNGERLHAPHPAAPAALIP
jgi:murein DD-endopeptidase MepM/ murein hydrolase activator NlpD